MTGPDFLLIGAMKSGTTTLAAQLSEQAGIFMTDPKEPNYFSDDDVFARGPDWYAGLFAGAAPGDIRGEASTHYTKLPTYPETVARAQAVLAAPKLIYMIRNPVARAVSHFIHEWSQGNMTDDMIAEFARNPEFVEYGLYARQLQPWIAAFGREQVHLTSLESWQKDPQAVLEGVAAFLGHAGGVQWVEARARENVSAERVRELPLHRVIVANPLARFLRRRFVPKSFRERVKASRRMADRPVLPETLREALEARFAEDRDALAALFPGYGDLALSYPFLDG